MAPGPQTKENRRQIINGLRTGVSPYELSKKYPKTTVYAIYAKMQAGEITDEDIVNELADDSEESTKYQIRKISTGKQTKTETAGDVDVVALKEQDGDGGTYNNASLDSIRAVRGALGITLRPKVVSIPTPELLFPAMVLALNEWGWIPMRPDDFIDTLIQKFVAATGFEIPSYINTAELERVLQFANEHGYRGNGHNGNGHKSTEIKQESIIGKQDIKSQQIKEIQQMAGKIDQEQTKLSEMSESLHVDDKSAAIEKDTTNLINEMSTKEEERQITVKNVSKQIDNIIKPPMVSAEKPFVIKTDSVVESEKTNNTPSSVSDLIQKLRDLSGKPENNKEGETK